ncbi:ROK family transcriptional regulator [Paenarthrobacter sp. Z7-10]|nr:ROK family transcriptional regulator [Paenarthrobacter sp. Z7-10]
MGGFNQAVVLDAIRRAPHGISRVELVQATGLSTQTVSNIVRKQLDLGLLNEGHKTVTGPGKPRTPLTIEPRSRFAVGVHLDPSVMTFVVLDLAGDVVARCRHEMPAVADPDTTVARMAAAIDGLVRTAKVPRDRVLGVGIASPGPINEDRGIVVDAPLLIGWQAVRLRESLRGATGLPVLLDKDVMAAAHAELWSSSRGENENFAFIYLGTGIGAGLVINGQVMRGASNNVGEIGHFSTGEDGPLCACGRSSCIGVAAMPAHLVETAVAAGVLEGPASGADPELISAAWVKLGALALQGDAGALGIVDASARRLARVVEDIANLMDVERVIFGGPMWAPVSERYLAVLQPTLSQRSAVSAIHDLEVIGSALGEDIAAVGAGCAILDHILAPKQMGLLLQD